MTTIDSFPRALQKPGKNHQPWIGHHFTNLAADASQCRRQSAEQSEVLLGPPTGTETAPWSPVQFVQEVKDVTRDRYVECEKSGRFAKAGGCKAVIKQRAGTVLMAVLELKDFVSEGLKYDVTGYGATAWSTITFGLRLVQNDLDSTQSIFEASAFLADLLARYASILLASKTSQQSFPETEKQCLNGRSYC